MGGCKLALTGGSQSEKRGSGSAKNELLEEDVFKEIEILKSLDQCGARAAKLAPLVSELFPSSPAAAAPRF